MSGRGKKLSFNDRLRADIERTLIMSSDELSRDNTPTLPRSQTQKRERSSTLAASASQPARPQPTPARPSGSIPPPAPLPPPSSPPTRPPGDLHQDGGEDSDEEDYDMDKSQKEDDDDEDISNRDLLLQIRRLLQRQSSKQAAIISRLSKRVETLEAQLQQVLPTFEEGRTAPAADRQPKTRTPSVPSTRPTPKDKSYAAAARTTGPKPTKPPTTSTQRPPEATVIPKMERQLVIIRDNTPSQKSYAPVDIRDAINYVLMREGAPTEVRIAAARTSTRNNIVLHTMETTTAAEVMKHSNKIEIALKEFDEAITQIKSGDHWEKVMIHGVDLHYFPDDPIGLNKLRTELETYNRLIQLPCQPRYLVRPDRREGKTHTSVVVSLTDKAQANHILKHGVLIMGTHHKAGKYYATRPWDICTKCQDFGHHWQRCTAAARCKFCAGPHSTRQHQCNKCHAKGKRCSHTILHCANCMENHMSTDPSCPCPMRLRATKAKEEFEKRTAAEDEMSQS